MKVYVCYYAIDQYTWNKTSLVFIFDDKYLGPLTYENVMASLPMQDRVGVFGFTDDKESFDIFRLIHNKKYLYFYTVKMSKKEFKDMKKNNLQYYIKFHTIDNNKKIPITKREYEIIDMDFQEYCYERVQDLSIIDPRIFSEKAQDILEKQGYVSTWVELYGSEEELDFQSYQLSFGCGNLSLMEKLRECTYVSRILIIFEELIDGHNFLNYLLKF